MQSSCVHGRKSLKLRSHPSCPLCEFRLDWQSHSRSRYSCCQGDTCSRHRRLWERSISRYPELSRGATARETQRISWKTRATVSIFTEECSRNSTAKPFQWNSTLKTEWVLFRVSSIYMRISGAQSSRFLRDIASTQPLMESAVEPSLSLIRADNAYDWPTF